MMPEIKNRPPQCAGQRGGPTEEADNQNINPHTEKSKPLTWNDYELLMALRYTRGGVSGAMARHFAQGETAAIRAGRHWTRGKQTPDDPEQAIVKALENELSGAERDVYTELAGKYEFDAKMARAAAEIRAMAEVLFRRNAENPKGAKGVAAPATRQAPEVRRKRNNELEGLRAFVKREWR
jgi:hypothetical protein